MARLGWRADLQVIVQQDFAFRVLAPYLPGLKKMDPGEEIQLHHYLFEHPPDILISEMHWFTVQPLLQKLKVRGTKSFYLARQVSRDFFYPKQVPVQNWFQPEFWDRCFGMEVWDAPEGFEFLNPIIMKEQHEIYPSAKAKKILGVKTSKPICVLAETGNPIDRQEVWEWEDHWQSQGFETRIMGPGGFWHFPLLELYNCIDVLVIGAGYNSFWESRYFQKKAQYQVCPRQFEDQQERVRRFAQSTFSKNGAAELVEKLT